MSCLVGLFLEGKQCLRKVIVSNDHVKNGPEKLVDNG